MIKLTNLLKEITLSTAAGTPIIYKGPDDLYKVQHFPAVKEHEYVLNNKEAMSVLKPILDDAGLGGDPEDDILEEISFSINVPPNRSTREVYIHVDTFYGYVAVEDSLEKLNLDQPIQNITWTRMPLQEITLKPVSNKITAHFEKDDSRPTGYELYGYVFSKDNPIIKEFIKDYQSKSLFNSKEIEKLLCVIPRTVQGAGLGIRLDAFGWGSNHDVRDELIEFLKKRGIQAFGGMHDGNLVVWIPKENVNIVEPN